MSKKINEPAGKNLPPETDALHEIGSLSEQPRRKPRRTKAAQEKDDVYPWLRLLELEVRHTEPPTPKRGKGRPPNPFPRKAVHVTLTDGELTALDELANLFSERFGRVHRGHLISFMMLYLRSKLLLENQLGLPEEVNSLTDLAKYLDTLKR